MRLWHKELIDVLPREQLVAQWRECSAIAGNILKNNTPNHILVNKVMDYDFNHFITYSFLIRQEMTNRGYRTMDKVWKKIISINNSQYRLITTNNLYKDWHNLRYFLQCYFNLQEKYDCGSITEKDWNKIEERKNYIIGDYCCG